MNQRMFKSLNEFSLPLMRNGLGEWLAIMTGLIVWLVLPQFSHASEDTAENNSVNTSIHSDAILPTNVITREEIERSGVSTISDLLFGTGVDFNAYGMNRPFVLGIANVAYLVNGKPSLSSIVNLLPLSAIERIEIINDNSASFHGAHAIGGAVNVVLRKGRDDGIEAWSDLERPSQRGGDSESAGALWFADSGQTNVVAGVEYWQREEIRAADRDYTKAIWTEGGTFGETQGVSVAGNTVVKGTEFRAVGDCSNDTYTGVLTIPGRGNVCGFPYAEYSFHAQGQDRTHFFFDIESQLNEGTSVYSEVLLNDSRTHNRFAPSVGTVNVQESSLPSNHDFYVAGSSNTLRLSHRLVGHGNRDWYTDTEIIGTAVGFRNRTEKGFDYDVSVQSFAHNVDETGNTFVSGSVLEDLISKNEYDFVNPLSQDATHLEAIRKSSLTLTERIKFKSTAINTLLDGDITTAGDRDLAWNLGAQIRKVSRDHELDHRDSDGISYALTDVLGSGGQTYSGDRKTSSIYGMLVYPHNNRLDLSVAGRYEHHSDVAETFSSQLAARMPITDSLLLRASIGQGETPPGFDALYLDSFASYERVCDVVTSATLCNSSNPNDVQSATQQYQTVTSGNTALRSEKSKTFNIGMETQIASLSLQGDYFIIDRERIAGVTFSAQEIVNLESAGNLPSMASVERAQNSNEIVRINIPITDNIESEISGLSLRSRFKNQMQWGELEVGLNAMHISRFRPKVSGQLQPGDVPRNRLHMEVSGTRGDVTATWSIGLVSSYEEARLNYSFKSWVGHDLTAGWKNAFNMEGLNLRGGILNVTDEMPSVNAFDSNVFSAASPAYSHIGRTFFLGAEMKW